MNGDLLKSKITEAGFSLEQVAALMLITTSELEQLLQTEEVTVGLAKSVGKCINKSILDLLDIDNEATAVPTSKDKINFIEAQITDHKNAIKHLEDKLKQLQTELA